MSEADMHPMTFLGLSRDLAAAGGALAGMARSKARQLRAAQELVGEVAAAREAAVRERARRALSHGTMDASRKPVAVGSIRASIDKDIPVLNALPDDPAEAQAAIQAALEQAREGRWTHRQVAVPSTRDISSILPGAEPTRLSIPIPGELPGEVSYRAGRFHAHKQDPFYLIHMDEHAPSGLLDVIKHAPEAARAAARRLFEHRPFVEKRSAWLKALRAMGWRT